MTVLLLASWAVILMENGVPAVCVPMGRPPGASTLKWVSGPATTLKVIGLPVPAVVLPEGAPQNVAAKGKPGIYHEIVLKVRVEADEALKKSLGITFARDGIVTLHGNSNHCWDPTYGGRWSFQYSVSKGPITERGLGRGHMPPANQSLQPTSRR